MGSKLYVQLDPPESDDTGGKSVDIISMESMFLGMIDTHLREKGKDEKLTITPLNEAKSLPNSVDSLPSLGSLVKMEETPLRNEATIEEFESELADLDEKEE